MSKDFKKTPAGEAWKIFKKTGDWQDARLLIDAMIELDKTSPKKDIEIEM